MPTRPALASSLMSTVVLLVVGCDQAAPSDDGPGSGQAQQTLRDSTGQDRETGNGGEVNVEVRLNHNPVVTSMTVESETPNLRGLAVQAHDVDGDALTFFWSTTCPGRFDDTRSVRPVFTPDLPAPSACAFHVAVSDGVGGLGSGELTVSLQTPILQVGAE